MKRKEVMKTVRKELNGTDEGREVFDGEVKRYRRQTMMGECVRSERGMMTKLCD